MEVNIEAKEASMDGLINEIITITIDNPLWADHTKKSALLVIHTIFRPLQPYEALIQDYSLSLIKIAGEGQLDERKTFLGWDIQTHSLQVFLPTEKEKALVRDIRAYIA